MKKNIFDEELKRRNMLDENKYSMIGTELKRIRISQSQTLASIASNICSVSYLCKIENAQMKVNRHMLNEICKKLNLSEDKVNLLYDLKTIIPDLVEAFFQKDTKKIIYYYEECKFLNNYRSKLIELIYYDYFYLIPEAIKVSNELLSLISVMCLDELLVLILFYAILNYYQENYYEAIDNLTVIVDLPLDNLITKLGKIYYFQAYLKTNHPMTLVYGQALLDAFLKNAEYSLADYIRYMMSIYNINNSMINYAEKNIEQLVNPRYKKSLEFFIDYQKKKLKDAKYYDSLRPFAKLLWVYVFHRNIYNNTFYKLEKKYYFDCDFSYNIANYLSLSEDKEKMNELNEIIIPNLLMTNNYFERSFFLQELCRMSFKFGRYKYFCKAFDSLMKGER